MSLENVLNVFFHAKNELFIPNGTLSLIPLFSFHQTKQKWLIDFLKVWWRKCLSWLSSWTFFICWVPKCWDFIFSLIDWLFFLPWQIQRTTLLKYLDSRYKMDHLEFVVISSPSSSDNTFQQQTIGVVCVNFTVKHVHHSTDVYSMINLDVFSYRKVMMNYNENFKWKFKVIQSIWKMKHSFLFCDNNIYW